MKSRFDLSHPLVQAGIPLIVLAALYQGGDLFMQEIRQSTVENVPHTAQKKDLSAVSLPRVLVSPTQGTPLAITENVDAAFGDKKGLIPEKPPVVVPEVKIPPPPSPLDTIASTLMLDAISSEGAFIKNIFTPWGSKLEQDVLLDRRIDERRVQVSLGGESRIVSMPDAQQNPVMPHHQSGSFAKEGLPSIMPGMLER